ncbi:MAG: cytochrome d ubiquinol oxidase subunit II [Candidatus Dormibacteraeota bacterium]|nr:cytochrome d ubiquinol oxidase subunit II [Candidatus Dormibacteraeota bacterium]
MSQQALTDLWFGIVALFWAGYLFLEGFDFGVGMLLPVLGREPRARSAMVGSIGPFWDGNEVWLIVAIGATFAALPGWYATLLAAGYGVFFIALVALIVRAVSFEFRGKGSAVWRRWWDRALIAGSLVPPLAWGLILTAQLSGLPINAQGTFSGRPWNLLGALPVLGAVTLTVLCVVHGATYLCLRVTDPLAARARRMATLVWGPAVVLLCAFFGSLLATSSEARSHGALSYVAPAVSLLALVAALLLHLVRRDRLAFAATGVAVLGYVATLFVGLFPNAVVSSLSAHDNLTAVDAASGHYTLTVMTIVAVIFAPIVLAYQAWTYWVFRRRLSSEPVPSRPAVADKT